jgi:poly(A) polymerase
MIDPAAQREFAAEIVRQLHEHGHVAYWAGGCVRDQQLGRMPKDYDVATNATPAEIREVFGRRRTLAVGAAFGVIVVLGRPGQGQVDVTTFRQDSRYSDGRHPDSVTFSTPSEDAQRRDFTINGMFYDPLADRVIDYVGGIDDLARRLVRAIGDPRQRFDEDKLRMLRAVRFAATFNFQLDPATEAAIREMASQIHVVSAERIAQEIRGMLVHSDRARAMELLRTTGLLAALLPVLAEQTSPEWQHTLTVLERLREPSFALALAALIGAVEGQGPGASVGDHAVRMATEICERWRLSNKETERVAWLLGNQWQVRGAREAPWPRLQRLLISEGIDDLLNLEEAEALASGRDLADVEHCRRLLQLPPEELNPPPLLTGDDLKQHGLQPGKEFKILLEQVRDAQLEKRVTTKAEALALVDRLRRDL